MDILMWIHSMAPVKPRLKNALEAMPKRGELAIELLVCRDKRADISMDAAHQKKEASQLRWPSSHG